MAALEPPREEVPPVVLEGSGLGIVVSRGGGFAVATGGDSHIALRSRVRVGVVGGGGGGGGGYIIIFKGCWW